MATVDNDELKNAFSKNIAYWLEKRGKTQADLYKRMEVSSATASDWCNGKKLPRTDKMVEIASWLMIELSDLLEEKEPQQTNAASQIVFRINDDERFRNLVIQLDKASDNDLTKIEDYINLVIGANQ